MKHTATRADFLIVFLATYFLFGMLIYVSDHKALWADETITIALVKSNSLSHLLEAVFLGLDATPPLYTSYGWFMSRYVFPSFQPDIILRVTNAALISLAISAIYASIREYVGRLVALACTLAFVLSQIPTLQFLTFEVRTYALYLCCTAVAIHFSLRASRYPSTSNLIYLSIFYCLLTASHTFGIIYVVCISLSVMIASGIEGNLKLCKRFTTATVPALIMFMCWIPVLRLQSQIPSWIESPSLSSLTVAMYIPASRLLIVIGVFVVLKALWRLVMNGAPISAINLSLSASKLDAKVVVLLPILFVCATASIWIFSVTIFSVFAPRYFFPNMLMHAAWITLLFYLFFMSLNVGRHHLFKAAVVFVLAIVVSAKTVGTWVSRVRIPCLNPTTGKVMEDEAALKSENVIVHSSNLWLTRQGQNRNTYIYPLDSDAGAAFGHMHKILSYDYGFMERFKRWASASTILNRDSFVSGSEFYILEDKFYIGDGQLPVLGMSQLKRAVEVRQVLDTFECRLWHVKLD